MRADEVLSCLRPLRANIGCGGSIPLLLVRESSCPNDGEPRATPGRLVRLRVLAYPPLRRPVASDHDLEFRSEPPSETESTVESCEPGGFNVSDASDLYGEQLTPLMGIFVHVGPLRVVPF